MTNVDPAQEGYEKTDNIDPYTVHKLVLDYLVHKCYSETSKTFSQDICPAKTPSEDDMDVDANLDLKSFPQYLQKSMSTLDTRKHIYSLVMNGQIEETFEACQESFPDALLANQDIIFELQTQKFIELVKSKTCIDAWDYAHKVLGKFRGSYLDKLETITGLLAYKNPYSSPLAHYLREDRKQEVAEMLNCYLLEFSGLPKSSCLENNVKQATVVREYLNREGTNEKKEQKIVYPAWSFQTFLEGVITVD